MRWLILLLLLVGCGDKEEPVPVTITLRPVSVLVQPQFWGPFPFAALADDNPTTFWNYIHHPTDSYRLGFDTSSLPPGVITAISTVVHRMQEYPPGLISALAFVHTVHYASGTVPMGTDNMPEIIGVSQVRTLTVTGLNIPVGDFTGVGVQEDWGWCCFGLAPDLMHIDEMFLLVTVSESPIVQEICIDGEFRLASQLDGDTYPLIVLGEVESPRQLGGHTGPIDAPGEFKYQHPIDGEIPECD